MRSHGKGSCPEPPVGKEGAGFPWKAPSVIRPADAQIIAYLIMIPQGPVREWHASIAVNPSSHPPTLFLRALVNWASSGHSGQSAEPPACDLEGSHSPSTQQSVGQA